MEDLCPSQFLALYSDGVLSVHHGMHGALREHGGIFLSEFCNLLADQLASQLVLPEIGFLEVAAPLAAFFKALEALACAWACSLFG